MIKILVLKTIKVYQKILSPDNGLSRFLILRRVCCFYPSCSQYCYLSVQRYGLIKGALLGIKRILKCHPWGPGGIDFPYDN